MKITWFDALVIKTDISSCVNGRIRDTSSNDLAGTIKSISGIFSFSNSKEIIDNLNPSAEAKVNTLLVIENLTPVKTGLDWSWAAENITLFISLLNLAGEMVKVGSSESDSGIVGKSSLGWVIRFEL